VKNKSIKTAFILEARSLLSDVKTYIYIAAVLLFSTVYTVYFNVYQGITELQYTLRYLALPVMLASPAITVGAFSGKKDLDRMLVSLGSGSTSLLFGRLLAIYPISVCPLIPLIFAAAALGSGIEAYLGILSVALFCCAYVTALTLISALCPSKRLCAIISYAFLAAAYLLNMLRSLLPLSALALIGASLMLSFAFCAALYGFTKSITVCLTLFSVLTVISCAVCNVARVFSFKLIKALLSLATPCAPLNSLLSGGYLDVTAAITLVIFTALCAALTFICLEKRKTE